MVSNFLMIMKLRQYLQKYPEVLEGDEVLHDVMNIKIRKECMMDVRKVADCKVNG